MKKLIKLLFALVFFNCCAGCLFADELESFNVEGMLETSKMKDALNGYLSLLRNVNPEKYTALGFTGTESELTLRTQENITGQIDLAKKYLRELSQIRTKVLSRSDYYDYVLFKNHLETQIYTLENFSPLKNPFYYLDSLSAVYKLIHKNMGSYHKRLENAFRRLEQVPQVLYQAKKYLDAPPVMWVENAISYSLTAHKSLDELIPYFNELLSLDLTTGENISYAMESAKDALNDYAHFLKDRILPVAKDNLASGKKNYEYFLKHKYLLDVSYRKVLNETEDEFYAVKEEFIEKLAAFLKKKERETKLKDYDNMLIKSAKHPPAQGLLTEFADEIQNAYSHFERNLNITSPGETIKILQAPEYAEPFAGFADYRSPYGLDENKNAELYIKIPSDNSKASVREMIMRRNFSYPYVKLSVVHLIMPGKFYYDTAIENNSDSKKVFDFFLIKNGWANYAFELALKTDYILTEEEKLALFKWKLLKSARAYADVMFHTKRADYEEVVKFLTTEAGMSKRQAESELFKISLEPAMAVTYIMGAKKLMRLSRKYSAKYGGLNNFHKVLFETGNIPADYIETELSDRQRDRKILK